MNLWVDWAQLGGLAGLTQQLHSPGSLIRARMSKMAFYPPEPLFHGLALFSGLAWISLQHGSWAPRETTLRRQAY